MPTGLARDRSVSPVKFLLNSLIYIVGVCNDFGLHKFIEDDSVRISFEAPPNKPFFQDNEYTLGTIAHFYCPDGYELSGARTAICRFQVAFSRYDSHQWRRDSLIETSCQYKNGTAINI